MITWQRNCAAATLLLMLFAQALSLLSLLVAVIIIAIGSFVGVVGIGLVIVRVVGALLIVTVSGIGILDVAVVGLLAVGGIISAVSIVGIGRGALARARKFALAGRGSSFSVRGTVSRSIGGNVSAIAVSLSVGPTRSSNNSVTGW